MNPVPSTPASSHPAGQIQLEPSKWARIESAYRGIRTSTLTQAAAGLFGFLVGSLFVQLFMGNPPALDGLAAAIGVITGGVMSTIVDALTPKRERRRHVAVYLIGAAVGGVLMMFLVNAHVVDPLVVRPAASAQPAATTSPTASASPS